MKPELSQIDSKYPEITKDRLVEIVLQQASLIQNMQERMVFIERELARLRNQQQQHLQLKNTPDLQTNVIRPLTAQTTHQHTFPVEQTAANVSQNENEEESTFLKVSKAIFHTSWMAFVLALVIQIILIGIVSIGGMPDNFKPFLADFVNRLSWGFLVCIALTVGTTATKFRTPLMGLLGLLFAPVAFIAARILGSGTGQLLGVPPAPADGTSPIITGAIKSVQYGILGTGLGFVSQYSWGRALTHIGVGLFAGVVFGGAILIYALQAAGSAVPVLQVVGRAANELLFPIGCALIMFLTQSFSRLLPSQR